MDRRRTTSSSDRRRRSTKARPKRKIEVQQYEANALTSLQPRLTELIPRRKRSLLLCLGIGLGMIGTLQALFLMRLDHLSTLPAAATTPLHLMGAGTLSAWCGSLVLAFAGLISILVFCIRQHKVDDYHGRYGMWLTVAVTCFLASADASTGLHATFNATMTLLTRRQPFGWAGSWWALFGGVVGIYLMVRILVDTWRSRGTVVSFSMMLVTYVLATMFFYRVLRLGTDQKDMMAHTSLLLMGHVFLAHSILTYARFVYREAAGEIGKKRRRSTKKKSRFAEWWPFKKDGKASTKKSKAATRKAEEPEPEPEEEDYYEEDEDLDELEHLTDSDEDRPLGKKARKRLKRQQRRAA